MLNLTPVYIAISIITLLIIAALVLFVKKNKKQKRLSTLTGLSFVFVIAGIVFYEIKEKIGLWDLNRIRFLILNFSDRNIYLLEKDGYLKIPEDISNFSISLLLVIN